MKELKKRPTVLVIDDEEDVASSLIKGLIRRDLQAEIKWADSATKAIQLFNSLKPEVIIADLTLQHNIGPSSGLNLIKELYEIDPTSRIIVLTGHEPRDFGIQALSKGACTYLSKPPDLDLLHALIRDAISICTLKRDYSNEISSQDTLSSILGIKSSSGEMKHCIEQIYFASKTRQATLIEGETGVGKGVVARIVHQHSSQSRGKFIRYQASVTNPDMVASELFGHTRGAFTGAHDNRKGLIEEAHCGTLFIDEIDSLSNDVQIMLLEVLQEKTFRKVGSTKEQKSDFRLLCALNKKPEALVRSGVLREDLFHRIAHCRIQLPPLRKRLSDIGIIAQDILSSFCSKEKIRITAISDEALSILIEHSWPGNIRELQAVLENAAYRAEFEESSVVEKQHIEINSVTEQNFLTVSSFRSQVRRFEESLIEAAMKACGNNQAQAAKHLSMDRTVLRRILDRPK